MYKGPKTGLAPAHFFLSKVLPHSTPGLRTPGTISLGGLVENYNKAGRLLHGI